MLRLPVCVLFFNNPESKTRFFFRAANIFINFASIINPTKNNEKRKNFSR
jgi:hypothetical protein